MAELLIGLRAGQSVRGGAPALAQADLSITAAGGAGVAGETSGVVLTHADRGEV